MDNLQIEEFDYDQIPPHGTVLFVSSRASGKSVMARDLLYFFIRKRRLKRFIIISPTMSNLDYAYLGEGDHVTRLLDFDFETLKQITRDQQQRMIDDPDSAPLVILFDDCIKMCNNRTKDAISRLFCTARHMMTTTVLISQSFKYECSPCVILNSNCLIVFSSKNIDNKKLISSMFLGYSDKENRDLGYQLIDKIAVGYRAMCIIQNKSNVINESVFYKEVDMDRTVPKNYIFQG